MKYIISISILAIVLFFGGCETSKPDTSSFAEVKNANEIYLKKGKQIAGATFATLSTNLQKTMKEGGVSNAIKYCNSAAFPLVDSLSQVHQAQIRRTSLKVRNPKDSPTAAEIEQLKIYEKQLHASERLKPVVKEIDDKTIVFYAPIHITPLCEKCHGTVGETVLEKDYQVIQQYYPEDKAIGYKSGDWRGMWSISFSK